MALGEASGTPRWQSFGVIALSAVTLALAAWFGWGPGAHVEPPSAPTAASPGPRDAGSPTGHLDVLVIGDSFTSGSRMSSGPTWARQLADRYSWNYAQDAIDGTGFLARSTALNSITDRLQRDIDDLDPRVVIVAVGASDSDRFQIGTTVDGARRVMQRVKAGFPEAQLVMLSPFAPRPIPEVEELESALRPVALEVGANYVDVTRLFYRRPELNGADGTHPTDAGHAYLAREIAQRLRAIHRLPKAQGTSRR